MRAYDYRLASFDRTHVFVANYVWDLPRVSRAFKDSFLAKAARIEQIKQRLSTRKEFHAMSGRFRTRDTTNNED